MENVNGGIMLGIHIMMLGHVPIIPHLSHWVDERMRLWKTDWNDEHPWKIEVPTYQDWLDMDFAIIRRCDALYRIPAPSAGADQEVQFCKVNDIPVFSKWTKLVAWLNQ